MVKELVEKALERLKTFHINSFIPALRGLNDGAWEDVLNTNGVAYYQWIPGFLEELKPRQIVELGGAMGVWDLMVLNGSYQDFDLWSITLPEHGLEFSYVVDKYKNFHPILGTDLDLSNWPKELDLSKTDLWFFDAEHTEEQLRKELDLYHPFFKKGAIILIDDIHSFGLDPVWNDLKSGKWGKLDCFDGTDPLHFSGYGICEVL